MREILMGVAWVVLTSPAAAADLTKAEAKELQGKLTGTWVGERFGLSFTAKQATVRKLTLTPITETKGVPELGPNKFLLDEGGGGDYYFFAFDGDFLHFGSGPIYAVPNVDAFELDMVGYQNRLTRRDGVCRYQDGPKHEELEIPCRMEGDSLHLELPFYPSHASNEVSSWSKVRYTYHDGLLIHETTWDSTMTRS